MAREYARIRLSRWEDDDWLDLSPAAQHLYDTLTTDPGLSYCGRVDWRPARLSARARGWTAEQIEAAAAELEQARFVLFDPDTEEALVRSLIRSDELLRNPKMGVSVVKAYGAMASRVLRAAVVTELRRVQVEHPEYSSWSSPVCAEQLARLVALPDLESVGYTNRITNRIGNQIGNAEPFENGDADQSVSPIPTRVEIGDGIGNADRSVSYPHTAYRIPQPSDQGGYATGERNEGDASERNAPPPPRCPDHLNHPSPPACGGCADARRAHDRAQAEEKRRALAAEVERRQREAADRRREIEDCNLCDAAGYYGQRVCSHDPEEVDRAKRGLAEVRAALNRKSA